MNEDELLQVENELGIHSLSGKAEYEWLQSQLPHAIKAVNDLKAAFRMFRFLRNDERLQTIRKDLMDNQEMLDYIQARIQLYEQEHPTGI